MRATSPRRRGDNRKAIYRGNPGKAVERRRVDYKGDGPSFTCPRCGAVVNALRPRHAPGGGKSKSWSVCTDELPVATDREAMIELTVQQAADLMLVTRKQIAQRFHVSLSAVDILRQMPEPVGKLQVDQAGRGALLYDARAVEAVVKAHRPRWLKRT